MILFLFIHDSLTNVSKDFELDINKPGGSKITVGPTLIFATPKVKALYVLYNT